MREWCGKNGVAILNSAGEFHGLTADLENLIKLIKSVARRMALDDETLSLSTCVALAVAAHNNQHRAGGYSPVQWAFGSAGAGHAFFEAGRLDGRGLVELEAYRVQAEKVYLEEQAKDVISKVRHTVAKRLFDCTPGRWVMYFRQAKGKGAG